MAEGQYELAAELLRFIVPPGDDNLLVGLPRPVQMNGQTEQQDTQQQGVVAAKPERVRTVLASCSLNAAPWQAQPQARFEIFCRQPRSAEEIANKRCVLPAEELAVILVWKGWSAATAWRGASRCQWPAGSTR